MWLMSSDDKQIFTLKISVTKQNFADFGIKIILLGQNSFEWLAFYRVEYCVF